VGGKRVTLIEIIIKIFCRKIFKRANNIQVPNSGRAKDLSAPLYMGLSQTHLQRKCEHLFLSL